MRNRKKGIVGEGHQAAAMHDTARIHVLALGPESGDRPLFIRAKIERARRLILKRLGRPGLPAGKLALLDLYCFRHACLLNRSVVRKLRR